MGSSNNYQLESADFTNGGGSGSSTNYNLDTAVIGDTADGSIISHNYQICSGLVQETYATCDDPAPPAPPEPPEPPEPPQPPNPPNNPPTSGSGGEFGDPPIGNYPDEPTEPENPGEPSNPDQPGEPTEPGQPTNPTQPGQPTNPTQPGTPVTPGQPVRPAPPRPTPGNNSGAINPAGSISTDPNQTGEPTEPGQLQNPLINLLPILNLPEIFIPQIFVLPQMPLQEFTEFIDQNPVLEEIYSNTIILATTLTPGRVFAYRIILPDVIFTGEICPDSQRTFIKTIQLNNLNLQPSDTKIYYLSNSEAAVIGVLLAVLTVETSYYYYVFWLNNLAQISRATLTARKKKISARRK